MTRDPIAELKKRAYMNLLIAILLIAVALRYQYYICAVPLIAMVLGWFVMSRALAGFFRAAALNSEQMRDFQRTFQQQFGRANVPRQVFWLLFAVAEADGKTEAEERELVRRFLLERFTDPATAADLRAWEADRIPPEQVSALALGLGRVLTPSERETVFSWCCLVAFADGTYQPEEHIVLQQIARSFGLEGHHARRIFHYARSVHLGGGEQRSYQGQGYGGGHGGYGGGPRGAVNDRDHALRVLGLEDGASSNDIRKRHRELVREFHPDKHQHLGEVAAKEAEGRFREVQAAYEVLAG